MEQSKAIDQHNMDYGACIKLAKEGKLEEIEEKYPAIYLRYINVLRSLVKVEMAYVGVRGVFICGPPGIGKTRAIRSAFPTLYEKMLNKWWDGYYDEEVVFMDELERDHIKFMSCNLKRWLDGYSFRAEYKGGSRMIQPKMFIIASNYTLEELFTDDTLRTAIRRRLKISLDLFEEPLTWLQIKDKLLSEGDNPAQTTDGTGRTVLPARSVPDPNSQESNIQPCCFEVKPNHKNYCVCADD